MQIKKAIKKGFTLVELVVVIAVIAILAATSVGVYFGMLESANRSADQQAVVQMNKILLLEDTLGDVDNILDVHKAFERNGLSTKSYTALAKDHTFYYDTDYNKILYVNNSGDNLVVEYPEEHKDQTWATRSAAGAQWFSLNLSIKETAPTGSNYVRNGENITATVTTANEFAYVMNEAKKVTGDIEITVSGSLDLMGANVTIPVLKEGQDLRLLGTNNATIKNIASNSYSIKPTDGSNTYGAGIVGLVMDGSSVYAEGVTFENVHIDGAMSNTGGCGVVVGFAKETGDVDLKDITIRNCTVAGNRSTGALAGHIVTCYQHPDLNMVKSFENIKIENTKVYTNGGRSSLVIGLLNRYFSTETNRNDTISTYNQEIDVENIKVEASELLTYNNARVLSYDEIKDLGKSIEYFYNSIETSKYVHNELYGDKYYGFEKDALISMTSSNSKVYSIDSFENDVL